VQGDASDGRQLRLRPVGGTDLRRVADGCRLAVGVMVSSHLAQSKELMLPDPEIAETSSAEVCDMQGRVYTGRWVGSVRQLSSM
jgi:hypothetical protein